jgi:hypothetical protein
MKKSQNENPNFYTHFNTKHKLLSIKLSSKYKQKGKPLILTHTELMAYTLINISVIIYVTYQPRASIIFLAYRLPNSTCES